MLSPFFLDYWYFHIPNYLLSLVIYTLFGRFLLGLFLPPDSPNYIWRFFVRLSDPALRVINWLIPLYVAPPLRPLVAAFHLYLLRVGFWLALAMQGLAPKLGAHAASGG